jgi:hypothetical protein
MLNALLSRSYTNLLTGALWIVPGCRKAENTKGERWMPIPHAARLQDRRCIEQALRQFRPVHGHFDLYNQQRRIRRQNLPDRFNWSKVQSWNRTIPTTADRVFARSLKFCPFKKVRLE